MASELNILTWTNYLLAFLGHIVFIPNLDCINSGYWHNQLIEAESEFASLPQITLFLTLLALRGVVLIASASGMGSRPKCMCLKWEIPLCRQRTKSMQSGTLCWCSSTVRCCPLCRHIRDRDSKGKHQQSTLLRRLRNIHSHGPEEDEFTKK